MKKASARFVILLCLVVYYCSNNPDIIGKYTAFRENRLYLGSDKAGYGELYGMCYLPEFRIPFGYKLKDAPATTKQNINLFMFSDSYLYYHVSASNFSNVDQLYKIHWFESNTYVDLSFVDPTKKTVLVIEMAERYVRTLWWNVYEVRNLLKRVMVKVVWVIFGCQCGWKAGQCLFLII